MPDATAILTVSNQERSLVLQAAARRSYFYDALLVAIATSLSTMLALAAVAAVLFDWTSATLLAAIAAGWIFLSRAVLTPFARRERRLGARFQDKYDSLVLGTPACSVPAFGVVDEAAAKNRTSGLALERYKNWYSIPEGTGWPASVQVAQLINSAWGARQHRSYAVFIVVVAILLAAGLLLLSLLMQLRLDEFLIQLALPSLPLLLDLLDQAQVHFETSRRRQALVNYLQQAAPGDDASIVSAQEQLFGLRATMPHVPGWYYRLQLSSYRRDINYAVAARQK